MTREELEKKILEPFKAIQIETLHGCNLNCKTCPNSVIEKHNELMDEEIFFKVLYDLKKINYKGRISPYLMNEPTLDTRLDSFIVEIRDMFPNNLIYISSNGLLLTDDKIQKMFDEGLGRLVLTFYSKEMCGLDGCKVYERLKKWETDSRVKMIKAFEQDPEVIFFNRGGNVKVGDEGLVMETCSKGTTQAFINYLGDMVICCSDYRYEVVAGNIMEDDIMTLYNCPLFKHYRRKLYCRDRSNLRLCSTCNWHRPQQYPDKYGKHN